jgi:hypothetical protein
MLFSDVTHWHLLAFVVGDGRTKDAFTQEDAFSMVPKSPMPEVWEKGFGLIEPAMYSQVVLGLAPKFSGAIFRVLHWVGHR